VSAIDQHWYLGFEGTDNPINGEDEPGTTEATPLLALRKNTNPSGSALRKVEVTVRAVSIAGWRSLITKAVVLASQRARHSLCFSTTSTGTAPNEP
jgi:hypothetical protein